MFGAFIGYIALLQWSAAYLSPSEQGWVGGIGFIFCFGSPFLLEAYLTVLASNFDAINLLVAPDNKWYRIFYNEPRLFDLDNSVGFGNTGVAVIPMAQKIVDKDIGPIEQIALHYQGEYGRRFKFSKGQTYYKNLRVNHGHVMWAIAHRRERSPLAITFTKPTLVLDLIYAGGDYDLQKDVGVGLKIIQTAEGDMLTVDGIVREVTPNELMGLYETECFEKNSLISENLELRRQRNAALSQAMAVSERAELLGSEFTGLMTVKPEQRMLTIQEFLMWSELFGDHDRAMASLKGPRLPLKLSQKNIVTALIAAIIAAFVYLKYEDIAASMMILFTWITASLQNQVITLIFVGIISGTLILGWRRARK